MASNITKVEKEMRRKYAMANTLQLVIVMDCTGSMSPWIEEAKSSIIAIIDGVKKDHPNADVQLEFVAYRDFCDGDKRLQIQTLTADVNAVRCFIGTLTAFGGGDAPEDIAGGLAAALEMPFEAEAKRIVLVADSPCHGSKFHDSSDDLTYQSQIEQSPDICLQMRELAKRGIDFTFIEIQPTYTAKMVGILQDEFNVAESHDGIERKFKTVPLSNASDVARFASVARSSASSSIAASKGRSIVASSKIALGVSSYHHYGPTGRATTRLSYVQEEDEEEDKAPAESRTVAAPEVKALDWSAVDGSSEIAAVRHSLHFRPNEHIDWKHLDLKHTHQETKIRLLRSSFAKGAMRSAHAMHDCNMEQYFVAKCYFGKAAGVSSASSSSLQNDVEMQIVAKQLATEFSLSEDAVDFIFTCWYEVKDPVEAGLSASMSMFTAEPYIPGE